MLSNHATGAARSIAAILALIAAGSLSHAQARAQELTIARADSGQIDQVDLDTESRLLRARLDLDQSRPGDVRVESHYCGCYDRPTPHYPYAMVLFITSKGALVARSEGREGVPRITPLAVRYGDRYCALDSEEECYGSFSHPCEFTDFRYGPTLAEFFPTCKSDGGAETFERER